jgi:hypothetical protein
VRRGSAVFLLCAAALLAVFGRQTVHADDGLPIEMSEEDECGGFVPPVPMNVTRKTITVNVVIALDGVSLEQAKQIVAKGSQAYAPGLVPQLSPDVKINVLAYHDLTGKLKGDVVSGFVVADLPTGDDLMSQLIRYYRTNYPNLKRDHVHLLTKKDVAAELVPGQKEYAVAGIANCIGGVGTKDAFAITEVGTIPPIDIGPLHAYIDVEAKNFAHEMGHVFGGHHHYAECVDSVPSAVLVQSFDVCSVMFNSLDFNSLHFSPLEAAAIRGFVEAHVAGTSALAKR